MTLSAVPRLAAGDFLDRVRRPAYLAVLVAAVALGYIAAPAADALWVVVDVGGYRGVYNSAYIGATTALAAGLWLMLGGFYVVRNAVGRDESTGVGVLLAATPLRTSAYLIGKFLGNLLVLGSVVGIVAVTAVVMQWGRGEETSIDVPALVKPFVLITLPAIVLTAAAALLFETVPVLRTGVGNVVWFFVWLFVAAVGQQPGVPLGGLGVHRVVESLQAAKAASGLTSGAEFSLGLTNVEAPLRTFPWDGFEVDWAFVASRAVLVLLALPLVLLPTLWFGRFDPSAARTPVPVASPPTAERGATRLAPYHGLPTTVVAVRAVSTARLIAGEVRVLVMGVRWWWLGIAAITAAAFALPMSAVTSAVLPAAWIWPALIWSRLGSQRHESEVQAILGSYPAAGRRIVAEWVAGVLFTFACGVGPLVRMVLAGDAPGVVAMLVGALFIAGLALALGALSRGHRLFQAVYLPLWYATASGLPLLDFMGAVREGGRPVGQHPLVVAGLAAALLCVVAVAHSLRDGARR